MNNPFLRDAKLQHSKKQKSDLLFFNVMRLVSGKKLLKALESV
jgi:hypothetical protein